MVYDFESNRPSTYRPRHYTSYTPTYYNSTYNTYIPKVLSSVWTDADRHSFSRRLTDNIISSRASSVPRFVRATSLESDGDYYDTVFRARRAISRARMTSEEPTFYSSYKSY